MPHPGQELDLRVALIRDLRRRVPCEVRPEDGALRWDEKPDGTHERWLEAGWQATPLPASPTVPKLIPIVTTAREADAVELAHTYTRRWPAQENAIRDWLIPRCLRCQSWVCQNAGHQLGGHEKARSPPTAT